MDSNWEWTVLQDPDATWREKYDAFEAMLNRIRGGWWPDGKRLWDYLLEQAQSIEKRVTHGLNPCTDLEGCVQETLLLLYQNAPAIETPRAWSRGTLRIKILESVRKAGPLPAAVPIDAVYVDDIRARLSEPSPGLSPVLKERLDSVIQEIERLPLALRAVAYLSLEGRSPCEMAEALGIKPETARQRLCRMRKILGERLR